MKRFLLRAWHLWQRFIKGIRLFPMYKRNFGFGIAWTIFIDGLVPPGKSERYINTIEKYVSEYLRPLTEKYKRDTYVPIEKMETSFDRVPVWCCWWQGEEKMPELVKMCNDRLRQVLPNEAELRMITQNNYRDYVELPDYIIQKFETGKISITALSDILRVALLSEYGGFWIDSTVFVSGTFPKEFVSRNFYAQRMYDPEKWSHEACKGRWCGFMMSGSRQNIIFRFLKDAFYQWWKDYDCVIDYVILDYFLLAAYHNIPVIQEMVDSVPDNNTDVFEMYKVLHYPYSKQLVKKLTDTTVMHKLTYKMDLYKTTKNGEETLYAHLLNSVNSHSPI